MLKSGAGIRGEADVDALQLNKFNACTLSDPHCSTSLIYDAPAGKSCYQSSLAYQSLAQVRKEAVTHFAGLCNGPLCKGIPKQQCAPCDNHAKHKRRSVCNAAAYLVLRPKAQ